MRENLSEEQKESENQNKQQRMKNLRKNLSEEQKESEKQKDLQRKKNMRAKSKDEIEQMYIEARYHDSTDPRILDTPGYLYMYDQFMMSINQGPTYVCNICWKFEYRTNVTVMKSDKYDPDIYMKCKTDRDSNEQETFICNTCDRYLKKPKMPPQAQNNGLNLNTQFREIDELCPLEVQLVSQIIPFMFVVDRHKGAQKGLKGHVVLVPADLSKITNSLPRQCNEGHLISLALKRRLSDKSEYSKTNIRPAAVNAALKKLMEVNHLYKSISISSCWESISEESDPELWKLLTTDDEFTIENANNPETDSDDEIEGNDASKEKSQIPYPTVFHNTHGPNVTSEKVLEIAPGEGQIPVSTYNEPNWEALSFVKQYSQGRYHFNWERPQKISPSKYVHARLKSCDTRFASDPQYIFQCLNWIEQETIRNTINFTERKRRQHSLTVGDIQNNNFFQGMISDAELYASFKSIRGTPQYFKEMMLDVLAKVRQFGPPTFFITFSAAEFHWTDIIKIVAKQTNEDLTDEFIESMSWKTKCSYLRRNPVTVARQIDYRFKQLWKNVLLSGMHPIGQILNYDDRREYQGRGVQHVHAPVHIKDAPKFDNGNDADVIEFIDKYITCAIPDTESTPELSKLVQTVQSHNHTTTCRKKTGVKCRFNAPWPPSEKTIIVRSPTSTKELKKATTCVNKVLSELNKIDIRNITLSELLEQAGVSLYEYEESLSCMHKKSTIAYKRKPTESLVVPYNPILLHAWKANMNIQFVTGEYGVLAYLTSYLCKPERNMSELMKMASKEASGKEIRDKLKVIGNVFQKCREVSTHEAIARTISLPLRHSNYDVIYVPTGLKESITRMLKPKVNINKNDDPDSTDVYIPNILDKYVKRPDNLQSMCLADFASLYKSESSTNPKTDNEDIRSYAEPISDFVDTPESTDKIELQEGLGKMKKRSRPCVIRWHKVSELKDPENYYLSVLQLYLPWRDESELKHANGLYITKFNEVREQIQEAMLRHQPHNELSIDDLDDNIDIVDDDDNEDGDDQDNDYNLYPGILDMHEEPCNFSATADSSNRLSNMTTTLMPNDEYYDMCSKLNAEQQNLFNVIAEQIQLYRWNEEHTKPFYTFLSGGAGVGKSHLVKVIAEYAKRNLKFPKQNLDQPSIMLTASTGKAAAHINGLTLHSAFHIGCKKRAKDAAISKRVLAGLQKKYRHLKIIVLDEISMIGRDTFECLDRNLQAIMNSNEDFGGVSILAVGDFLQLPPVGQKPIFEDPDDLTYESLSGNRWKTKFKLYELTQIVRQVSDPEFAGILSRIREGKQTDDDCAEIEKLHYTDTSQWPNDPIKLFTENKKAGLSNKESIANIGNQVYTIRSKDKGNIPENASLNQTGNLPNEISICVGARFMLTVNIDTEDHLINGSLGTIEHIDTRACNPLQWIIYIHFDDEVAGNRRKSNRAVNPDWVPIVADVKSFSMNRNGNVNCQRKQFPGILAHAITVHKSQGSTYEYMIGCMDDSRMWKNPGMTYTMLSRAQNRSRIKLNNFASDKIKHYEEALKEINRMREECPLVLKHKLTEMSSPVIMLLNIRSWNKHIGHLTNDPIYLNSCSIICLTETKLTNNCINRISNIDENWKDAHYATSHGLAICYEQNKVLLIRELPTTSVIEIAASVFQIEDEQFILILVYRTPGSNATYFLQQLSEQVCRFQQFNLRTIIVGDFNLDLHVNRNLTLINNFKREFAMEQKSQFATHNDGGILDLIFDTSLNQNTVHWQPTAFSDHYILLYSL